MLATLAAFNAILDILAGKPVKAVKKPNPEHKLNKNTFPNLASSIWLRLPMEYNKRDYIIIKKIKKKHFASIHAYMHAYTAV